MGRPKPFAVLTRPLNLLKRTAPKKPDNLAITRDVFSICSRGDSVNTMDAFAGRVLNPGNGLATEKPIGSTRLMLVSEGDHSIR